MNCLACGHKQESGKFCGKCGEMFQENVVLTKVSTSEEQTAATENNQAGVTEPNIHVERIKAQSKMYGSYFVQQLKKPLLAFDTDKTSFSYGLTSTILIAVVIALSLTAFVKNAFGVYGASSFSIFSNVLFFILMAIVLALVSLFIINRFFGPQLSFKSIISLYGGHLSPLILLSIASLLLLLVKSFTYGNLMLSITFIFIVFILPLYLISSLLTNKTTRVDPFFGFILYLIIFTVLFFIFITILADSSLGNYMNYFMF